MSIKTIIIKNIDTVDHTYAGQLILDGESYTIQSEAERVAFASSILLNQHLWAGTPLVAISDGVTDMTGTVGDAYLKLTDADPKDLDGKKVVHQTSRMLGTTTYFAGEGDDESDPMTCGGGPKIRGKMASGVASSVFKCRFNVIDNKSYLHEGYLQWEGGRNDCISVSIIPRITPNTVAGSGTDYNLYGGYLIVPASPGTGTLVVDNADRVLVQVPLDENGNRKSAGYFDAVWNTNTKVFDSITPNYGGTGEFNMFTVEVNLARFVASQCILGNGFMQMQTSDIDMVGHNMQIKIDLLTNASEPAHDWWWNATFTMHRKRST